LFENGGQFLLEPGMQDGIGARIDRFGSQLPSGWSKQGEQFAGGASNILVILLCGHALWLPRGTGMRDRLIGTGLIFRPQG
jgi:hypothetical protein